jgi:DNA recombination protein RmuC
MTTVQILILSIAFIMGGLLGILLATLRARSQFEGSLRQLENQRSGLESAVAEIRSQAEIRQKELSATQQKLEEEQRRRISAETDLANQRANIEEQKRLLQEAESKLKSTFEALASEALRANVGQFLDLAKTRFATLKEEATSALEQRKVAIDGLVKPLSDTLAKLEQELTNEKSSRQGAYSELRTQVQQLAETSKELRKETGSLVTSLRQPQVKGRWGELTLRRAVELAGMSPHCDFDEQPSSDTEEGYLRPDLIVHLPGGTQIVIDAKVPLHAFLKVVSATSDADYKQAMTEHARLIRSHISQLSSKEYWKQFEPTPEFVVLFVPGESFFSAALEQDGTLIEDAIDKRIVLASPTTLIALLRAIAYGWRHELVTKNAEQIRELGKELYDRAVKFTEHMDNICGGLEKATEAYNKAVGSLESRLLPSARKFKTLGVAAAEDVPPLKPIEVAPRRISTNPEEEDL